MVLMALGVIFILGGCLSGIPASQFTMTGTVTFVELEGGFYGIIGENNEKYDPIDLPAQYQVDGLRVKFTGRIRDDMASIHMWGKIIEIIGIEDASTGIQGRIFLGPMCPTLQSDIDCPDQPYPATIDILNRSSLEIAEAKSDDKGIFEYLCLPGSYTLMPRSPNRFIRAGEQTVNVKNGEFTEVTVLFDSRIR